MPIHDPTKVPPATCPHCGDSQDAATGLQVPVPSPGDLSVCIKCTGVSIYQQDMSREKWPDSVPLPAEALYAQAAIGRARAAHRPLS